ncbi:MAG: DUF2059 domain-containing protein [Victivallaceae bacterium]
MKKIALLIMALLAFVSAAIAVEPADAVKNRELAEKLLDTMKISAAMTRSLDMMKKMQLDIMSNRLKGKDLQNMEELNRAMMELVTRELSWEKLKAPIVNIYAESFTAEELDAMVKFYESPIGKKLMDKQPEMQQKTMKLMQSIMMKLLPEMEKVAKDFAEKQKPAAPAPAKTDAAPAPAAAATPADKPAPAAAK